MQELWAARLYKSLSFRKVLEPESRQPASEFQSPIVCRAVLLLLLQASVCLPLLSQHPGKELLSPRVGLCCRAARTVSRCRGLSGAGAMLHSGAIFASLLGAPSGASDHFLLSPLAHLCLSRGAAAGTDSRDQAVVGNWPGAVGLGEQGSTGSLSRASETRVSEGNNK